MAAKTNAKRSGRNSSSQKRSSYSVNDVLTDFDAAYQLLDSRQLDEYAGQLVAVLDGKVVGTGADAGQLRETISRSHRVHPERIAIIHVVNETTVNQHGHGRAGS